MPQQGFDMSEDVKQQPPKPIYLNNKELLIEVKKSRERGEMTPTLAKMLVLLCAKYGKRANFGGYTYNDDMQAYAMLMLVRTWKSFDPEKGSNPFAFFTQCIKHSFIQFLNQEKRQRTIRDALLVDQGLNPSYGYSENGANTSGSYDDEQDFFVLTQPELISRADIRFGSPDEAFEDDLPPDVVPSDSEAAPVGQIPASDDSSPPNPHENT